jgi:hypothetical protein
MYVKHRPVSETVLREIIHLRNRPEGENDTQAKHFFVSIKSSKTSIAETFKKSTSIVQVTIGIRRAAAVFVSRSLSALPPGQTRSPILGLTGTQTGGRQPHSAALPGHRGYMIGKCTWPRGSELPEAWVSCENAAVAMRGS